MRITVPFETKKVPIAYRMMLVSLIKDSLKKANEAYYQKLYIEKKRDMKPFASAVYLKNFSIKEDTIDLEELNLTISSPDQEFMFNLYNGLLKTKQFEYQSFNMKRNKIMLQTEKNIISDKVIFRTLSPILIEDKDSCPLSPYDEKYEENLNHYADLILKSYRKHGLKQKLKVKPELMKKQVIKEQNHYFRENHGKKKWLYFTAYDGTIKIQGHITDLQLLYQLGLSKRRGQCFGLLEVEREEV